MHNKGCINLSDMVTVFSALSEFSVICGYVAVLQTNIIASFTVIKGCNKNYEL